MPVFNIAGTSIQANTQLNSAPRTLAARVKDVTIQLTDPNTVWDSTTGNVKQWGLQLSTDGGTTWDWGPVYQGLVADSSLWLPFGSRSRSGGMPLLHVSAQTLAADVGNQLRLAIVTDTNIVLGAQITVN